MSATVRLWKQDKRGEWFPVIGEAHWDEFAPVSDEWAYSEEQGKRAPTGRKTLDQSGNWARMPVVMITKCAESQALRAGWPETFGGVYTEEELDAMTAAVSASEALEAHQADERMKRVGGAAVMLTFDDTGVLERVPVGQVADRCMEFLREAEPLEVHRFNVRNTASLREFWAHSPSDALEIKRLIEAKERQLPRSA